MKVGQAYLNGDWIDASNLAVPLDDVGFQLGVTVVERLRTFGGEPFEVEGHVRRLRRSLEIVKWDAARIAEQVRVAIGELITRNREFVAPGDDWAIQVFVTPGRTADAANPTVGVYGFPLDFHRFAKSYESGIHLCITDIRQTPANCWPPELKCRSRMHYYLADREAARRYPGSRAVLLDQQGFIGEASTANVMCWFRDRGLVTPKQGGVLPGISQAFLFGLADEMGIERREADITPEQFAAADELFLTSTSVCLLPVVKVDDAMIGDGKPGPMFAKLLAAWSERVGLDVAAQAKRFKKRSN
jgi:branched-chain amino acid aminotransferase